MMPKRDRIFYSPDSHGDIVLSDLEKNHINKAGLNYDSFDYMYHEIFHCSEYTNGDPDGCDYERRGCKINRGDVVIDIGSNIGIFARLAWERGASKIIGFEPQRKAFLMNVMNSKDNMEIYNLAISDTLSNFNLEFGESPRNIGGGNINGIYRERGNEILHSERVVSVSLDSLFNSGLLDKVDFLKVDVEGAEVQVFRGISDENLSKFRCISMEVHGKAISEEDKIHISERISDLGYKRFTMHYSDSLEIWNCWKE